LVDSNSIIDALVLLLKDIPDLVEAVGDDDTRIFAYKDEYPESVSLRSAIYSQPTPSIMVAFQARTRTGPIGGGGWVTIRHDLLVIIRPSSVADYASIAALVTEGVPTSVGVALCNADVVSDCDPFGVDLPELVRESDENGIDYYTLLLSFRER
jgi:hypothetical protein